MKAYELIHKAKQQGVTLYLKDDALAFRAQHGRMDDELREQLTLYKPLLIEFLQQLAVKSADIPVNTGNKTPTPMQKGFWLMEQVDPGQAINHLMSCLRLEGELDRQAMTQALSSLIERHHILRTRYQVRADGELATVVAKDIELKLAETDLTLASAETRETLIRHESRLPFDLSADNMLRVHLFRYAVNEHVLVITLHHIAADGWSQKILIDEFSELYQAYSEGVAAKLALEPLQHADYAAWQKSVLAGERGEQLRRFWSERLADLPKIHHLPTNFTRPPVQDHSADVVCQYLEPELVRQLQQIAKQHHATLFMVLNSAFAILLGRYAGEDDIVVGTPVANRKHEQLSDVVGCLMNVLVLRSHLAGNPSFIALLQQNRDFLLAAYEHQDLPFENLLAQLQPERSTSYSPLFQILIVLHNQARSELELAHLRLRDCTPRRAATPYDLSFIARESNQGLEIDWEFSTALFNADWIKAMSENFAVLLRQIIANPDLGIQDFSLISPREVAQLQSWNHTSRAFNDDSCIHHLIEQQAARTPQSIALSDEHHQLSYRQLDQSSNQLARYLRVQGVLTGDRVALLCERSVEMVVAILACFKAGAAYLPIDPQWPVERQLLVIADAKSSMVICHQAMLEGISVPCLQLEYRQDGQALQYWQTLSAAPLQLDDCTADSLAYVIYTSGSTGQPKGVMIEHRALVNRIQWMQRAFDVGANDRILQKTPYTFDVSVWEFVLPLVAGAQLYMARPGGHLSPDYLVQKIREVGISLLHFVPSMLNLMLETSTFSHCNSLRAVICSGEALHKATVDRFDALALPAALYNLYGPTEAAIDVTWQRCSRWDSHVSIGRAIDNIELFVFDEKMQNVPIGVIGELYIGGVGLARGYLDRPTLTASQFIQHPQQPGQRIYRTGDRVKYLPDGTLEYMGRRDHQVKLRGIRIELEEIAERLRCHEAISDAFVTLQNDVWGQSQLVAYVQSGQKDEQLIPSLRRYVAEYLPEYMRPMGYLLLDKFPTTANGKLDRRALPAVSLQHEVQFIAPVTATECVLCEILQDVLALENVGLGHSFFQLGGDSIQAIRVVARAKAQHIQLTVRQLMSAENIGQLAQRVQTERSKKEPIAPFALLSATQLEALKNTKLFTSLVDAYPMTALQRGMLFHGELSAQFGVYHDIVGTQLRIAWDRALFEQALARLVERHEVLRSSFYSQGELQLQLVSKVANYRLVVSDLRQYNEQAQSEQIAQWLAQEKLRSHDLNHSPWRIQIFVIADHEISYFLSVHHALLDGWSVASFDTELFDRYWHLLAKRPYQEPSQTPAPYVEFVAQEVAALQQKDSQTFWQHRLSGADASWWTSQSSGHIERREVVIPRHISDRLATVARELRVSERSVLLASHLCIMSLLSGRSDVLTSAVVNARPEIEGSAFTLGLFLNAQPVRLDIQNMSWQQLISAVEREVQTLSEHKYYPLAAIQSDVGIDFSASLFNFTNFHVYRDISDKIDAVKFAGNVQNNYKLNAEYSKNLNTGAFELALLFDSGVFCRTLQQRICKYAAAVLQAMCENLQQQFDPAVLLEPADQSVFYAATPSVVASEDSLMDRFAATCARFGQKLALQDHDRQLSYAQLDRESDLVALELARRDIPTHSLIGLCLQPSIELMVSLLGILKYGCAYVPLDAAHPVERLRQIAVDADLAFIICDPASAVIFDVGNTQILPLDNHVMAELAEALIGKTFSGASISADQLAYGIFTSGSTGRPKGVLVEHRNVVRLLDSAQSFYNFDETDVWPLFHSYAFDVSVWEMWGAFFHGGTLLIVPRELARSTFDFYHFIKQHGVTVLNQTPGAFYQFIEVDQQFNSQLALRYVILAGDKLAAHLLAPWYQNHHDTAPTIVNMYGITETTVHSTIRAMTLKDVDRPEVSPVGRPLSDLTFYLLDEHQKPVMRGVPGEIYIAGDGVARGYLNRPALNAERFAPLLHLNEKRMYRSGDLAVLDGSGEFLYRGRIDKQVKIRGYRIELGEIQSVLNGFPAVQNCHIDVIEGHDGHRQLVAYVACEQAPIDLQEQLRQHLNAQLPLYMVPAFFVIMTKLPLNVNGKVNVAALPKPESDHGGYKAPRTQLEQQLCTLWQELLPIDQIGVSDNFFFSGGDSLLAVKLVSFISQQLGKKLSLQQLMSHPTIEALATILQQQQGSVEVSKALVPDLPNRHQPFPLTDVQQAYWFGRQEGLSLGNVGTHSYTEVPLPIDYLAQLQPAWNQLIQRHDMLRMVIDAQGQQRILAQTPVYQMVVTDLRQLDPQQRHTALANIRAEMSHQLFAGDTWPLFDLRVSVLNAQQLVLHVSMDALIVDASSVLILTGEFGRALLGAAQPQPLALSFRDYVLALEQQKSGLAYQQAKSYWLDRLADFPASPTLPLRATPAQIKQPSFDRRALKLAPQQWHQLKEYASRLEVTPTVLLLGIFADVIRLWSENERFALNLTLFNRQPVHPDVFALVGDFTTLILLECDGGAVESSFVARLHRLQQQLWRDLDHNQYTGVELLRALNKSRGEAVGYPVVVTSTLGLPQDEQLQQAFATGGDEELYSISQTSQVWLDCKLYEVSGWLHSEWDFVAELFSAPLIDDMFAAFHQALQQLSTAPQVTPHRVVDLPAWQVAAMQAVNHTEGAVPTGLLHQRMMAWAEHHPADIAVVSAERTLSYAELEQLSRHYAHQLMQQGVRANELVAIVMDKGWQQIVAVFAILRAGAAYLPIDSRLPFARIEDLLKSGEVRQVLIDQPMLAVSAGQYLVHEVSADVVVSEWPLPAISTVNTDLAYVIFTSGSTGQPKGVMIDHRGALNTVVDINERYKVDHRDAIYGISNLNFDLSVYDIFGPLSVGGRLILPAPERRQDPRCWVEDMVRYGVTLWNSVPAFPQMLVEYAQQHPTALCLRLVLMSGDWIPVELPLALRQLCPSAALISLGGATEASIWSIYYPIEAVAAHWKSIPYGRALKNQTFHVLKDDLTAAPLGVEGDLYIGGIGLATGYWQDEERTAASFITQGERGERLYRTGDRGRWLEDMQIEFLGRRDQQVKIQGHRIELGEIEANLKALRGVNDAVVSTTESQGGRQLVAYIVPEPQFRTKAESVQFKLEEQGVRALAKDAVRLPAVDVNEPLTVTLNSGGGRDALRLSFSRLAQTLGLFHRQAFGDYPKAKALYPSAGHLYPVQLYLYWPGGGERDGLAAGYYYYHPLRHELVLMRAVQAQLESQAELLLCADLQAIEPVYGSMAAGFCALEQGYMLGMLQQFAPRLGLHPQLCSEHDWWSACELGQSHQGLGSYRLFEWGAVAATSVLQTSYATRRSYREFVGDVLSEQQFAFFVAQLGQAELAASLSVYVYLSQAVAGAGYAAGWYVWHAGKLQPVQTQAQRQSLFSGREAAMAADAALQLLVIEEHPSDADGWRQAGALGQRLYTVLPSQQIGWCAVGGIDDAQARQLLGLGAQARVCHVLVGGVITEEAKSAVAPSAAPVVSSWFDVEHALQLRLPSYMCPKYYMEIAQIPLSANGKVDRSQLPKPAVQDEVEVYVTPKNQYEQFIQTVVSELLQQPAISVSRNLLQAGIDSLAVIRLVNRIKAHYQIEISISAVFQTSDLSQVAELVQKAISRQRNLSQITAVMPSQHEEDMESLRI